MEGWGPCCAREGGGVSRRGVAGVGMRDIRVRIGRKGGKEGKGGRFQWGINKIRRTEIISYVGFVFPVKPL